MSVLAQEVGRIQCKRQASARAQEKGRANETPMELVCWFVQGYLL